jgi:signal transduction histidine kinase
VVRVGTEPATSSAVAGLQQARARHRAIRRWSRPAAAVIVATGEVVTTANGRPGPGVHGTSLVVSIALATLIAGFAVTFSALDSCPVPWTTRFPALFGAGVAVQFTGAAALMWVQSHGYGGATGAALAAVLAVSQLRRRPLAAAGLMVMVLAGIVAVESRYHPVSQNLSKFAPFLAVFWLVVVFGRLRDAKTEAEDLLLQLEESRGAEARAAALAERQRLAREVHDVLAHSLAGLMLQLEGARMLAASSPSDPRLPGAVERAHELAKDGLDEARRAIGMLRGEELPGPAALGTLTGQFEQHSGIRCSFGTSGEPRNVRPDASLALYRVTQEALTNVVRHADARRVEVSLTYAAGQVSLTIEDFGAPVLVPAGDGGGGGPAGDGTGSGHGLTGMRERAELLGGTLTTGATPAGFRVELRVPA